MLTVDRLFEQVSAAPSVAETLAAVKTYLLGGNMSAEVDPVAEPPEEPGGKRDLMQAASPVTEAEPAHAAMRVECFRRARAGEVTPQFVQQYLHSMRSTPVERSEGSGVMRTGRSSEFAAPQKLEHTRQRIDRMAGSNAYRLSIPGRFHSVFAMVNKRLLGELRTVSDTAALAIEPALSEATWCYQTAVTDLPLCVVEPAIVQPLGELFAGFCEVLTADPSCGRPPAGTLRRWIMGASEMVLRFIELLADIRDRRIDCDPCFSPRLGTLPAHPVVVAHSGADPTFACLQSFVALLDTQGLAELRPRAGALLTADVARLCDAICRAHRALAIFSDRPTGDILPSPSPPMASTARPWFQKRGQGARDLVVVQSAFDALLRFFSMYDDDSILSNVAAVMSVAKMLDSETAVLRDAVVTATTVLGGAGSASGASKDVSYRGSVFCQQVFPRLLAALQHRPLDELRARFAVILGVCTGLSYRAQYLMMIANEVLPLAGGVTFAPFVHAFARILFKLYKPMHSPYTGWIDHPQCSQRHTAAMGSVTGPSGQQALLLLRTAHLAAVMAVMRTLSSIAVLEPVALVPYRTFFAGLLFSAGLPTAATDPLCVVCAAVGKTSPDNAAFFVRAALTALKHGTPATNALPQLRFSIVSMCANVVSTYPTIVRASAAESSECDLKSVVTLKSLTRTELALPRPLELEDIDLAPQLPPVSAMKTGDAGPSDFDAVTVLQELLRDPVEPVRSLTMEMMEVVVGEKMVRSLPAELALRDAMLEERLAMMQKRLDGGLVTSNSEMAEMRMAIEQVVGQVDVERVAQQALVSEVVQVKERVAEIAVDLLQVQSDLREAEPPQHKEDIRELRGILESQIANLRKQVGEFVRRVPVPRRIAVQDANVLRVSLELHFSCDCPCNHHLACDSHAAVEFADLREYCLFGSDAAPPFVVRTANWRKWIKVCVASLSLAVSFATASVTHAVASIAGIYEKLKAPGDGEFVDLCRQLQEQRGGALMTSAEQDELLAALRASGFFQTFSWDSEVMQWCCASCRSHVPRILEREACSAMFLSLAGQLHILQERSMLLQEELTALDGRLPREGWITKQGHKVKNWKKRLAHLDAGQFWYSTGAGQPPIRVVPAASISCIAPYDLHARQDLKLSLQNKSEGLAMYLETDAPARWALLFVVGSAAEKQTWMQALADAKRRVQLVADMKRVDDDLATVEQRMVESEQHGC